jgi:hypothetical protein
MAELELRLTTAAPSVPAGRVRLTKVCRAIPSIRLEAFLVAWRPCGWREDPFPCSEAWEAVLAQATASCFGELDRQPARVTAPSRTARSRSTIVSRACPPPAIADWQLSTGHLGTVHWQLALQPVARRTAAELRLMQPSPQ